ncbi:lipase I [Coprinopsis marcescibilis]|uniref:Carboxylic ester hydrolase n=1 Tax=Coprinopsis marcescibilis TaxID=230819 RepID=A0A5C3KXM1_COPMA|nr:lipase I [Coprinopsis marcescibilis]
MLLKVATALSVLVAGVLAAPEVRLHGTRIIGQDVTASKVDFFGGVPFAEPPVGRLRFRKPVLKTSLETRIFNATNFGSSCLQPALMPGVSDVSEDCLTINIHRPTGTKPGDKLPVLFWTYGGAFLIGGSASYNGSELVAQSVRRGTPIVYVNFNYRLGPFGYPNGKEAHDRRSLNLGLEDILAALRWVHANIDAFGGDKRKVTIFGESAGGMNIGVLYLNRELEQLVRGAIFESGQANGRPGFAAAESETNWQGFVRNIPSCASVATSGNTFSCLQKASQEEIRTAYLGSFGGGDLFGGLAFTPTIDAGPGGLYPDFVSKLYKSGKFAKIPFIAGNNLDEGTLFATAARSANYTEADLKRGVIFASSPPVVDPGRLEEGATKLLELYPEDPKVGSPYGTGDDLFGLPANFKRAASLQGDQTFDAPRRQWIQTASAHGVKAYGYLFTQPQPLGDPAGGVPHAAEIGYIYGNALDFSPEGRTLTTYMMDYWISFTVNLDPNDKNGSERPIWPLYTESNQVLLQLNGANTSVIRDDYRKDGIGYMNDNAIVFRR